MLEAAKAFNSDFTTNFSDVAIAYEGASFTPTNGTPYQEIYDLPATNSSLCVDSANFEAIGIFQISLKYPYGFGIGTVSARAKDIAAHYSVGKQFTSDGVKVIVAKPPDVRNLGQDGDRIVQVISVRYRAIYAL